MTNTPPKTLELTVTATKTFKCIDCGERYAIKYASLKFPKKHPTYCKYCNR